MKEFKQFTTVLAEESGQIIQQYFRTNSISIETKKDESPVTIADKKAEEKIRELITKHYPEHGIIGEEFGKSNPDAEYQWIIDPIDGTKSFISGAVTFGTLIALTFKGEPIIGAFNQPILKEFMLGDNVETLLNGQKVSVKKCDNLKSALLLTTDLMNFETYQNLDNFMDLIRATKLYRMWGDCYGYYLVASGFADIMIDPIMSVWDSMALVPIIRGAGGVITDYFGGDPVKGESIVASVNPQIHNEVIKILNK